MGASDGAIWFFGDLSDPWVASIADSLPGSHDIIRADCPGELPSEPLDSKGPPKLIVLHRQRLVGNDAERLKGWRSTVDNGESPALILCVGPYVRYEELERYSGLVDLVLSEATAAEVLPRHVARLLEGRPSRAPRSDGIPLRVCVAGSNVELTRAVGEACAVAGYRIELTGDPIVGARVSGRNEPSAPTETVLIIWDVPVLDPDWSDRLERHCLQAGPVIALMGFADRTSVALARSKGAIACLELPLNLDDLIDVIDRFSRSLPLEAQAVPLRVESPHHLPPRPRRRVNQRESRSEGTRWPVPGRQPTIE